MAKNKTTETNDSVADFINTITDEVKRKDSFHLVELMQAATGLGAKMWGHAIIGFGTYHYKYESGREGDAPLTAFSPRKAAITLYLATGFAKRDEWLQQLGKYKAEGGCVYVKKLTDINEDILKQLIADAFKHAKTIHKA
jgi:nucleoid DNA-binding protein